MTQQSNGLSPRANKHHHSNNISTSTSTSNSSSSNSQGATTLPNRFFHGSALPNIPPSCHQEPSTNSSGIATFEGRFWRDQNNKIRPRSPKQQQQHTSGSGSNTSNKLHGAAAANQTTTPMRSAVRFLAIMATMISAVPLLSTFRVAGVSGSSVQSPGAAGGGGGAAAAVRAPYGAGVGGVHCSSLYHGWSDSPTDRGQCAPLLPPAIIEGDGWLVGVHMDRAPSSPTSKKLRGSAAAAATPRSLPHQYFVRAVEATLTSIATADSGASVDVVLFSEGRWGGIVDEVGVPIDWSVPQEICAGLGLHCTQTVILVNDPDTVSVAEALDCLSVADVFVASESDFSKAAASLSDHIKVLTDKWEEDDDEMMLALNPATTIAGMPASQRRDLETLVHDYQHCSSARGGGVYA